MTECNTHHVMKKLYLVRTLIFSGSLLLQLSALCFQSRGAANNNFSSAQVIAGATGTTTGNNSGTTKEPGEPDHAGNAGGSSVWFRWIAPASGRFSFDTAGSAFDTLLAVYTGASVNALNPEASNDDGDLDLTSAVSFQAASGTTYYVAVDGYDGEDGALVLNWAPEVPPTNNHFANAMEIAGLSGNVYGRNSSATKEPGEPDHAGNTGGSSVWFRWTAPLSGQYSFDTIGSAFDTLLAVYTGAGVNALTLVTSDDNSAGDFASAITFPAAGGMTYYVAIDGFDGEVGELVLNWSPAITDATGLTFTTLHSFSDGADGSEPFGGVVVSGSTLYGATLYGGSSGNGTVYKINADGTGYTNLHSFNYTAGANPYAVLVLQGNTLYGTTRTGGSSGQGTVFAINTNGTGFTNLHSFTPTSDGALPFAGVILSGDTLYGTTPFGGSSDNGTVFAVKTNGTGFTNLHSFTALIDSTNSDGAVPFCSVIMSGNTLYGTTVSGGSVGVGTLFAVNANGTGFTNLHHFNWYDDGGHPHTAILSGNRLYGTTGGGGSSGQGTVFAVNTNGTGFTTLHSFADVIGNLYTNRAGASPFAGLILSGDTLYGTASFGGSSGQGTVFSLNTNGMDFTILHSFTAVSGLSSTNSDGALLYGGLALARHTLYGAARSGGSSGKGTVFSLSLPPPRVMIIPSGANVILTWPFNAAGFTLQSTTNLFPADWSSVAQPAATNSGQISVTVPTTVGQKFFRLKSQ
jgi:uncharacterized repeat protein (TIGR03803 family)